MVKTKKATLTEVAKLAGVSRAAAGKALNGGSDKIGVGAEARKRILLAAKALNYQPNMAAQILAGGQSRLIGVFLDSHSNYRNVRLLQELERLATAQGFRLITSYSHDSIANMREDYHSFQRYGVVGFICLAHDYPNLKQEVIDLFTGSKNVVFMEPPCVPGMPYIRTSRVKALTELIADAVRMGYRRIGTMHKHHSALSERILHEEFVQSMKNNGLKVDERLVFEYPKTDDDDPCYRIRQAFDRMILPYQPDFLYIDDAVNTITLRNLLFQSGLKLAIHGGNDDPLFKCIDVPSFDPGYERQAAELLNLLLHPECRSDKPVIQAIYRTKFQSGISLLQKDTTNERNPK